MGALAPDQIRKNVRIYHRIIKTSHLSAVFYYRDNISTFTLDFYHSSLEFRVVKYRKECSGYKSKGLSTFNVRTNHFYIIAALNCDAESNRQRSNTHRSSKLPPSLHHPLALTFDLASCDGVIAQHRGQPGLSKPRRWCAGLIHSRTAC